MIEITMYKAGNGDCISIQTNTDFVLIDGGTAQSFDLWKNHIIGVVNKIDTLIITHIDNDHVNGIIKLLEDDECPEIGQVYFNGVEQLFGSFDTSSEVDRKVNRKLQALVGECKVISDKEAIGYSEGTSLSYLLNKKELQCNEIVSGGSIYREKLTSFNTKDFTFTVIGPEQDALVELKKCWENTLKQKNIKPKIISRSYVDAFELYVKNVSELNSEKFNIGSKSSKSIEILANTVFAPDTSLPNKCSFSFLIENEGKSILYLGDSHAETIESWLDSKGINCLIVDAVKISHHGSKNNTSLSLLERIDSKKYLISTNGKSHGHPDLETLARISLVNKHKKIDICINYELSHIPSWFLDEIDEIYKNITISMNVGGIYL